MRQEGLRYDGHNESEGPRDFFLRVLELDRDLANAEERKLAKEARELKLQLRDLWAGATDADIESWAREAERIYREKGIKRDVELIAATARKQRERCLRAKEGLKGTQKPRVFDSELARLTAKGADEEIVRETNQTVQTPRHKFIESLDYFADPDREREFMEGISKVPRKKK